MKSLLAVAIVLVVSAVSVSTAWGVWWPDTWCPPGCSIAPTALTYVIPVTKDTNISIDAIHTNDGAAKSISIGSGSATSGTFGLFSFNPAPVRSWLDAEMAAGGLTLDSAASACYVKVSFSVLPAGIGASPLAVGSPTFYHPIALMAVNASDNWAEGNGLGGTAPYNWTTPYAATDASPRDYKGNTDGWHPSSLTMAPTGPILEGGVPFEKLTGQQNSSTINTWQYGVRSRVTLDPAVWMGLLYGRAYSPLTGTSIPGGSPAVCGLKTYDVNNLMDPASPVNLDVSVYSKEAGANLAPRLEVTLVVAHPRPWGFKPGDYNQDGLVDVADLGVLARYYGTNGDGAGTLDYSQGDINGDGLVDVVDLGTLAQNYDSGYAAPVPEPGFAALLTMGAFALLRRSTRK